MLHIQELSCCKASATRLRIKATASFKSFYFCESTKTEWVNLENEGYYWRRLVQVQPSRPSQWREPGSSPRMRSPCPVEPPTLQGPLSTSRQWHDHCQCGTCTRHDSGERQNRIILNLIQKIQSFKQRSDMEQFQVCFWIHGQAQSTDLQRE